MIGDLLGFSLIEIPKFIVMPNIRFIKKKKKTIGSTSFIHYPTG